MSPQEAAAYATGGEGEAAAGHAAAEGIEPDAGGKPIWVRAFRNTSPNPPIEAVGGLQDIREHWEAYGLRGIQKLGNVDDAEAWIDLTKFVIGACLELTGDRPQQSGGGDETDSAATGGDMEGLPTGPQADKT